MRQWASITASAMWTTQNDTRILTRFWPAGLWNAAHSMSMAECAVKAASRNVERPGSIQVLPEPLGLSFMHHRMR